FIGSGGYGLVYRATWNSKVGKKTIVLKNFKQSLENVKIDKEFGFLSLANHDNIVKLFGTTKDEDDGTVLVMEYAECGSLHDMLHKEKNHKIVLPHMQSNSWMLQCAKGIKHLHEFRPKILHRDLKPQNLLLFNDFRILKICDFGTVKQLVTNGEMSYAGTPYYMAPEVSETTSYTEKCDVYSFGITFWEVMARKKPFSHLGKIANIYYVQKCAINGVRPPLSDIQHFNKSDQIIKLIEQCWHGDPEHRPTIQEVIRDLNFFYTHEEWEDYRNLEIPE
ncbi:hypothetical protein KR044_003036, partial [Drosophila immigrans]